MTIYRYEDECLIETFRSWKQRWDSIGRPLSWHVGRVYSYTIIFIIEIMSPFWSIIFYLLRLSVRRRTSHSWFCEHFGKARPRNPFFYVFLFLIPPFCVNTLSACAAICGIPTRRVLTENEIRQYTSVLRVLLVAHRPVKSQPQDETYFCSVFAFISVYFSFFFRFQRNEGSRREATLSTA